MIKVEDLVWKNIAILWYGIEWKSTLNFLINHKINAQNITILDTNTTITPPKNIKKITWNNYDKNLDKYDVIFKSAGIPFSSTLTPYKKQIITQVQFFFDNYKGKVIAITASKWKSTITSLIYSLLINAGYNTKLVWNIWNPVLEEVDFNQKYDYIVIELSSYMLTTLKKKNFISVLGSIFPEHLDRHWNFKNYTKSKLNVLKWSKINIVNHNTIKDFNLNKKFDNIISYWEKWLFGWKWNYFTENDSNIFSNKDRILEWNHNLDNISAMIAVWNQLWISNRIIQNTIKHFQWLPHRMQKLWTFHWIQFIDDAISTTPESTIQALKTFWTTIDTILLWWTDRWYDFHELVKYIKKIWIKNIVLFPESGKKIFETFGSYRNKLNILQTDSMKRAVDFCIETTKKWKLCLLSTASPSYSIWKNFEEKGTLFQEYIKNYNKIWKKQQ